MAPKKKPTKRTDHLTPETAALMVAMADISGPKAAANYFGISLKTVWNWRQRVLADARLTETYLENKERLAAEWVPAAIRFVNKGLAKLEELIEKAKPDQIRDVAGAVHLVSEKLVVKDAVPLVGGNSANTRKDKKPSAPAGSGAGPAGGAGAPAGATGATAGTGGAAVH